MYIPGVYLEYGVDISEVVTYVRITNTVSQ